VKVVAIIQARMGSTRLPGKVLKDLCGETVLARVVHRTRRATLLNEVVVATSVQPADDAIVQECGRLSVACFRGDEADVLDRYYRAAEKFSADAIVRITSDCPLIDPEVSDKTIRAFLEQHPDYASNVLERRYPRGLDTEVMTFAALESARRDARDPYQREHVTPFLYQHPERFRLVSVTGDRDYSHYRWTLDTVEDLEFLRAVYERHAEASDPSWQDVLRILEGEPDLAMINQHVIQKTT
jgi:spore coat polysaccharide biosynthesis protein SpsF